MSRKCNKWNPQQDELLRAAVAALGCHCWTAVSSRVPGRTASGCAQRWNYAMVDRKKGYWTKEEDEIVLHGVAELGTNSWKAIALCIKEKLAIVRSMKQVRERYSLHLDPRYHRGGWSPEEDALLATIHKQWCQLNRDCRTNWCEIAETMAFTTSCLRTGSSVRF